MLCEVVHVRFCSSLAKMIIDWGLSTFHAVFVLQIPVDTEIEAKQNNMISKLITFRITKAKAKVNFGVRYLCGIECEKASVPININMKAKSEQIFRGN